MLLSDKRILEERENGNVVIEPFDMRQLGTNSYDCRLGEWYFEPTKYADVINFTDEEQARDFWGEPHRAAATIVVKPGTTILAHTQEVIGARNGFTTTMLTMMIITRVGTSLTIR